MRETALRIIWGKILPGRQNKHKTCTRGGADVFEELQGTQCSWNGQSEGKSMSAEKSEGLEQKAS